VQDTKLYSETRQNITTKKHVVSRYPFSYTAHFS